MIKVFCDSDKVYGHRSLRVIAFLTLLFFSFTPLEKATGEVGGENKEANGGLMPPSAHTVRERSSLTGFTQPAYSSYKAKIIRDKVNVRLDSTAMAPSLGYLYEGEMVKVIEERYDWCKVILPKRLYCYVASPFLRKISDNKAEVVASELNLRSEPSQQSYIVGRARKGGIFFIKEENNGWVKVRGHPYMWGWINKSFLQKISEPLDLEIEGVIISVNKENCKANYLLKGKNGDYLLWIVGIEEKGFIHKKVKIVGKKVNEGCSYVWVQKIFPEK